MPAKHQEPLSRIHVQLSQRDLQKLRHFYPHHGAISQILRGLLRRHIRRLEEAVSRPSSASPPTEILSPTELETNNE
jgi:hypothetical protein